VNGQEITLDVDTDSLADIIERINVSVSGVTASINTTENRVALVADNPGNLVLDSGNTDFFVTLGIQEGVYEGASGQSSVRRTVGLSSHGRRQIAAAMEAISQAINDLFHDSDFVSEPILEKLRQDIQAAVAQSFDSQGPQFRTQFGVNFDFRPTNKEVFRFSHFNRKKLMSSLNSTQGVRAFRELFFADNQHRDGLAERLLDVVDQTQRDIEARLRSVSVGSQIDVLA
jgi:hypothetical protein